jgi:hypothetical protein
MVPLSLLEGRKEGRATIGIYEKWKRGEIVQVQAAHSGKIFTIKPERWAGITLGYTVLVNGKSVPQHYRKMVDDAEFRLWCENLVEVAIP